MNYNIQNKKKEPHEGFFAAHVCQYPYRMERGIFSSCEVKWKKKDKGRNL